MYFKCNNIYFNTVYILNKYLTYIIYYIFIHISFCLQQSYENSCTSLYIKQMKICM